MSLQSEHYTRKGASSDMAGCDDFWAEICIEDTNYCYAISLPVVNKLYKANFSISALGCAKKTGSYENITVNGDEITVSVLDKVYPHDEYKVVIDNSQDVLPTSQLAFRDDFFRLLDLMSILLYQKKDLSTLASHALTTDTGLEISLSIRDYMRFAGIKINAANQSTTKKSIIKSLALLATIKITDRRKEIVKRDGEHIRDNLFVLNNAKIIDGFSFSHQVFTLKLSQNMEYYIGHCRRVFKYPVELPSLSQKSQYTYIIGRKLALDGSRKTSKKRGANSTLSIATLLSICPTLRRQAPGSTIKRDVARFVFEPIAAALDVLAGHQIIDSWSLEFDGEELSETKLQHFLKGKRYADFLEVMLHFELSYGTALYSEAEMVRRLMRKKAPAITDMSPAESDALKKMIKDLM